MRNFMYVVVTFNLQVFCWNLMFWLLRKTNNVFGPVFSNNIRCLLTSHYNKLTTEKQFVYVHRNKYFYLKKLTLRHSCFTKYHCPFYLYTALFTYTQNGASG